MFEDPVTDRPGQTRAWRLCHKLLLRGKERTTVPAYWLLKTEPADYSWGDLAKEGKTVWDGVKAPAALKNISRMKTGDLCFIYHTGGERAVVGTARVARTPYPDPLENDPRRLVVELVPLEALKRPVTLERIKKSGLFPDWELVRQPRLSVVPVSREQWEKVLEWAG